MPSDQAHHISVLFRLRSRRLTTSSPLAVTSRTDSSESSSRPRMPCMIPTPPPRVAPSIPIQSDATTAATTAVSWGADGVGAGWPLTKFFACAVQQIDESGKLGAAAHSEPVVLHVERHRVEIPEVDLKPMRDGPKGSRRAMAAARGEKGDAGRGRQADLVFASINSASCPRGRRLRWFGDPARRPV